jgi:formiminotetrahydrofolate cyclodeaminase
MASNTECVLLGDFVAELGAKAPTPGGGAAAAVAAALGDAAGAMSCACAYKEAVPC